MAAAPSLPFPLPRTARPGGYSLTPGSASPMPQTPSLLDLLSGALTANGNRPTDPVLGSAPGTPQEYTARLDPLTPTVDPSGKAGALDPHQGGGLLANIFGWNGNPLYEGIKGSGILEDLAYGLSSGKNLNEGFQLATQRTAEMAPERRIEAQANQSRQRLLKVLQNYGDGYADIADGLSSGVIDARDGYNLMFKRKAELTAQAEAEAKNSQYAQFITDPTLKQLVAAGAMDGAEAYKLEHPSANGGEWGTAIQPGVDAAGNLVPLRAAPGGGLSIAPMPDGVRYAPDTLAGAKSGATVDAKTAAAARAALPGAQQAREVTDKAMAEIRANAAGMKEWFSQWGVAPRGMALMGGTPIAKFAGAAKNASAQAFMQARAMLKGGGQITDYEGRRAEDAYSRMQAAMDSGDQEQYLRAIADFEDAVISGYNKLVSAASGDYSAGGPGITGGYGGTDYKSKYGLE